MSSVVSPKHSLFERRILDHWLSAAHIDRTLRDALVSVLSQILTPSPQVVRVTSIPHEALAAQDIQSQTTAMVDE